MATTVNSKENTKRPKLLGWLATGTLLVLLVGGLWYAQSRGWLASGYHRVHQLVSKGSAGRADHEGMSGMNMAGMGMDMGDMKMGPPSGVPGHAEVTIPSEIQQRIGLTVGEVKQEPLKMSVRTVGIVRWDETKVSHVHLKTEGWVEELRVNFIGQQVREGEPLLTIYSPEFLTTQQEYLNALQADRGRSELADQSSLAALALRRLQLWGVSREELDKLKQTKKPQTSLMLRSPRAGTVITRNAFEGQRVTPQDELYVVADLSTVWVQAKVYEYELPHVEVGQPVSVTLPALPDQKLTGKVVFIQPTVEEATRTVQVRVELPNPTGLLRLGMFANVEIQHAMGEGLLVPTSAVIRTGERDIAFHAMSSDRFMPVEVRISAFKFGDRFHVLEGLKAGDKVVTSANFLIDSESRLRIVGMGGMPGMPGMNMGNMKGMDQGKKGGMEAMDHSKMKH
jgi:Cu(I)/Ag(I) efflux system membrane fusion protein